MVFVQSFIISFRLIIANYGSYKVFAQSFTGLFCLITYGWLALESLSYWHLSITAVGLLLKGGIASIAFSRASLAIFDSLQGASKQTKVHRRLTA
jgi:hypothetical protein